LLILLLATAFPTERASSNILIGAFVVILCFVAVAAKENGVVAPLFLLVYRLVVRRDNRRPIWTKLIAAGFSSTAAFMIARFTLVPAQSVIFYQKASYVGGSFWQTFVIQPRIWSFQLLELVWPKLLCADQTDYSIRFITLPFALAALAAIIVVTAMLCRKNAGFAAGVIFYFLAILPTSNLVPIYRPMADRYLYLPMFGVCWALGAVICRLKMPTKQGSVALRLTVAAAICIFFGFFTIERIFVWHNSISLWQDTVEKNPLSFTGCNNLGFALFDAGEFKKAVPFFTKASQLKPDDADPVAGLAITYDALGMSAPAEETFRKAVSLDKRYAGRDSILRALLWTPQQADKLQIIADRVLAKQKAVLE
jgi:tetratricopeptide (TPR) repeat protein